MGMDIIDLLNYLSLEGPGDKDLVPNASEEDAPPLGDESANEGEAVDKGEDTEKEPNKEEEPME